MKRNRLQIARDENVKWKDAFKAYAMRTSFTLHLTRPMLEFLCAVADDVCWDRSSQGGSGSPENWIATEAALTKRGLVARKSDAESDRVLVRKLARCHDGKTYQFTFCKLTPAGRAVVDLIKCTGLFIESDHAILKKHAKRVGKSA
jgi:hypothetical protein